MERRHSKPKPMPETAARIDPQSPVMEFFKTIRTNIEFSSIDKKLCTISVTSSSQGEGKSSVSDQSGVELRLDRPPRPDY
jgi:Mrp family chromosome partitioning ATPase